jgi:hypothetical protein
MLTPLQRSLIIGTMLGDGAMRCKREALLEVNHSLAQSDYVDWKYHILKNLVRTPPRQRSGNGDRVAYRFTTLSLPDLTPIHDMFYKEGKKVVPVLELDAAALAVWFMDDGSRSRRAVYFNTQQFAIPDQIRLTDILRRQWGIESSLNRDKSYHRIRIAVRSMERLRMVIGRRLLPSLAYKLPD